MVAIGAIFCFVAVAATYFAFNVSGAQAGNADDSVPYNGTIDDETSDAAGIPANNPALCCVSGIATDRTKQGIPNVTITLWETRLDPATGEYVNVAPAGIPDNPQLSNSDPTRYAIGTFIFFNVAPGMYNLTAEMDGHIAYSYANVSRGTCTLNVALADVTFYDPVPVNVSDDQVTVDQSDPGLLIPAPADGSPYCTLAGLVTDKKKHGIAGARVTLMTCHYDVMGGFVNDGVASVADNPQLSNSDGSKAQVGTYTFYGVPCGFYNITAEKADAAGMNHLWYGVVNASRGCGTYMNNIALPDLIISA